MYIMDFEYVLLYFLRISYIILYQLKYKNLFLFKLAFFFFRNKLCISLCLPYILSLNTMLSILMNSLQKKTLKKLL